MKTHLIRLSMVLLTLVSLSTCGRDDEGEVPPENIISTYEVASIGSGSGASGSINFCREGRVQQIAEGSFQGGSPDYTATFGMRTTGILQDTTFGPITIFIQGRDFREPLGSFSRGALEHARMITERSPDVDAYVQFLIAYEGKTYSSFIYDERFQVISKFDPDAEQNIEFTINEELLCPFSQSLIIESRLSYDGYVYNIRDLSDSVTVDGFSATIFHNSF